MLKLVAISVILFVAVTGNGKITIRPQNTFTRAGERTVLKCCSHDKNTTIVWKKYIADGQSQIICKGEECQNAEYIIEKSAAECSNLVIVSTTHQHSTLYECKIDDTDDRSAAYVIPYSCFASNGDKSVFVEGEIVTFRCEVLWTGRVSRPELCSCWKNERGTVIKWNNFTGGSFVSTWIVSLQGPELKPYTWDLRYLTNPIPDDDLDKSQPVATWTSKMAHVDECGDSVSFGKENQVLLSGIFSYFNIIIALLVIIGFSVWAPLLRGLILKATGRFGWFPDLRDKVKIVGDTETNESSKNECVDDGQEETETFPLQPTGIHPTGIHPEDDAVSITVAWDDRSAENATDE